MQIAWALGERFPHHPWPSAPPRDGLGVMRVPKQACCLSIRFGIPPRKQSRVTIRYDLEGETFRSASAAIGAGSGSAIARFDSSPSSNPTAELISGAQGYQHNPRNGSLYIFDFAPVVYDLAPGASVRITLHGSATSSAGTGSFRDADDILQIYGSSGEAFATADLWIESIVDSNGAPASSAIVSDSGHDYGVKPPPISFDEWAGLFFLSDLADPPISETEDSDNDGFSNMTEYLCQTRPDRSDVSPQPVLKQNAAGNWDLEFYRLSPLAKYEIFRSTGGLSTGDFQSVMTLEPEEKSGSSPRVELPQVVSDKAFYRVKFSAPSASP